MAKSSVAVGYFRYLLLKLREKSMLSFAYRFLKSICSYSIVILVFGVQSLLAAGSGTIRGKVFDKDTRDVLPGATILVKGTSLGAASDLNGAYIIRGVPTGEQTLSISYIGYNSVTLKVNVIEGKEIEENVYMEPTAITGKTVIVTAQAQGQMQAINQQLSSNTIVNVVSAAKIQELPDFNAAEAIGRLPGISTLRSSGEADQVVIRGIAPQYNLVSIDNITLASTQKYNRAVDLTMISPYMLESIDVYKAITPDMEANAIGGIVNMQLREAPSGLHSDLMWQSGYTAKTSKYNNYRAIGAISDRFFDDRFGVYVLLNSEQYDRSADNMSANYRTTSNPAPGAISPVVVTGMGLNRHFETRGRYGANLILDYKLPQGSIQFINMASRLTSKYTNYFTNYDYIGLGLTWNYQSGKSNTDMAINALQGKYDFGFMSMDMSAANSYSRNFNPYIPNYYFSEYPGVKGPIPINKPPEYLFTLAQFDTTKGDLSQIGYNSADFKENDQVYSANFKVPFVLGSSASGFLKFGGKYRYNYRTNDENAPYMQLRYQGNDLVPKIRADFPSLPYDANQQGFFMYGFTNHDQSLVTNFLDDRFGTLLWVPDPTMEEKILNDVRANYTSYVNWHDGDYENKINDYRNIERYYAGYGMAELDLGQKLTIVGGARYEEDKMLFTAYHVKQLQISNQVTATPVTAYPENHYWLPMVQAKYNIVDWADIRYSFTKTLARPDFTELAPYLNMDLNGNYPNMGNPNLRPASSLNHDFMLTLHNNTIGLFSIGAFYKTVSNFSYWIQYPLYPYSTAPGYDTLAQVPGASSGTPLSTYYNNPYKAFLKGIEGDFETRLWYLPSPFSGIVLSINYTHIKSNTYYPLPLLRRQPFGRVTREVIVDSSRAGRLIDQPDDILNASFGYDYKGFSGRISFLYQGAMTSGIGAVPEEDSYTHEYFRIDASVRQKLPWSGLYIYLDVNNINSRPDISAQQTIGGFTSEQYYGLTADLGIRYTL
jgi:TonB-dependent receptor